MKKFLKTVSLIMCLLFIVNNTTIVQAATGDMGFFGGITEGSRLPKTTAVMLAAAASKKPAPRNLSNLVYKEVVFLSGQAVETVGLLNVKQQGDVLDTSIADIGTYKVTYTVSASEATDPDNSIRRNIVFTVNWRREGNQIVKDYEVSTWSETITIAGQKYELDSTQSHYSVSLLEDNTPGVVYSKGDLSVHAFYAVEEASVSHDMTGSVYGYTSAWSNTEVQRLDGEVYADNWQIGYQVRPSVSVSKTLQYSKNEPKIISFDGNYREVMQNQSGLTFDIFNAPSNVIDPKLTGSASISVHNTFEQLPTYDLNALKSHFAVTDIHKLFSLGILSGETAQFNPSQLITRGQFVTMLVKAIKLPIEPPAAQPKNSKKAPPISFAFPDVTSNRTDYPYIMAAFKAGIADGRGQGRFYPDHAIQREEAIAMILHTIGLTNLGLEPTTVTAFADDADIALWAKKELYAAQIINIISPDSMGKIYPKVNVSKAEAAALINSIIEYMRSGMQADYAEHIVNYTN